MDTTKIADNIDGLADREFKTGGMKLSFGSIMAILAFLSTVVGGLYGGFVMYQKIEEVAGLDLGEYQQAMDVMDAKVTGISEKVEESVEYSRDIKNGLREDILSIEKQTDRVEDMVRKSEDKVRTMIDNAEVRFENQRERVRVSQSGAMKELEEKLMDKMQRALDNPLADQEKHMTEFEKADVDGNGSIDQSEWDRMAFEDKRLKMLDDDAQRDAQRKMAWFALFGMLLYPFAIILCNVADLDEAMKSLASIAGVYFVSVAAIVAAFYGKEAYTKGKANNE